MKVSATFNEQGLSLLLTAENDTEQRMVGAVLGQPQQDSSQVADELLHASIGFEGHWQNKKVSYLKITLLKDQRHTDR